MLYRFSDSAQWESTLRMGRWRAGPDKVPEISGWGISVVAVSQADRYLKWPHRTLRLYWRVTSWLLEFYILTTSKVISRCAPTCDSAHSWQPYSAARLRTVLISQSAGFTYIASYSSEKIIPCNAEKNLPIDLAKLTSDITCKYT